MHVNAHLDLDVIAHETSSQVSVLIDITAPGAPEPGGERPAATLEVVLDRSGSMAGARLSGAKTALLSLVDRLHPADRFGLVAFDGRVEVVVPAGPLTGKAAVKRAIAHIQPGGNTDLSAGYLRALQEARRAAGPGGATVLLISDGHANAGVTDAEALGAVAADARAHNITTSTLGFGLGYDEQIMSAIARGGAGNELFAEEADTAVTLIAGEAEGLLTQAAQAASLLIRMSPYVREVQVVNDLPVTMTADGVLAELGSFYAGETRKLLVVFGIPAVPALGLAEVASLEFTYVELPALAEHKVTVPLHVNVVPGDQAAGRIPDPLVRTELAYLTAQQAKRRASAHLSDGHAEAALQEIHDAQQTISAALAAAPADLAGELEEEAGALRFLAEETEHGVLTRAAKFSSMDATRKSRHRGRRPPAP